MAIRLKIEPGLTKFIIKANHIRIPTSKLDRYCVNMIKRRIFNYHDDCCVDFCFKVILKCIKVLRKPKLFLYWIQEARFHPNEVVKRHLYFLERGWGGDESHLMIREIAECEDFIRELDIIANSRYREIEELANSLEKGFIIKQWSKDRLSNNLVRLIMSYILPRDYLKHSKLIRKLK